MSTVQASPSAVKVIAPPSRWNRRQRKFAWRRTLGTRATRTWSRWPILKLRLAQPQPVVVGREQIRDFLAGKWQRELDYRLIKALWAFTDNHIAVRFQYEWHNEQGQWHRSYGNELWEFDEHGLMRRREASINDVVIQEAERKFFWPAPGPRPADDLGIPDVR